MWVIFTEKNGEKRYIYIYIYGTNNTVTKQQAL